MSVYISNFTVYTYESRKKRLFSSEEYINKESTTQISKLNIFYILDSKNSKYYAHLGRRVNLKLSSVLGHIQWLFLQTTFFFSEFLSVPLLLRLRLSYVDVCPWNSYNFKR